MKLCDTHHSSETAASVSCHNCNGKPQELAGSTTASTKSSRHMQNHHEPSAFYLTSNWLADLPEILTRSKHQSQAAQHTFLGSTRFTRMTSSSSWDTESASQMRGVIMSNMKVLTFPECLSLEQTGYLPSLYQVNYLRCSQCVTISQMTVCAGAFSSSHVHRHACFLSVSHFSGDKWTHFLS